MSKTSVFVDGSVYSPVDPYATALLMTEQIVEWVGGDAGAQSILDQTMAQVELEGDLLTPAFVHAGSLVESELELESSIQKLKSAGYAAGAFFVDLQVFSSLQEKLDNSFNCYFYGKISHYEELKIVSTAFHGIQVRADNANLDKIVRSALQKNLKVSFLVETEGDVRNLLATMNDLADFQRAQLAPRIDGIKAINEEFLEAMKNAGIGLGFSSDLSIDDSSIHQAVASGALVFLGSDSEKLSPRLGWDLALSYVVRTQKEHQISARATFNAMTRGVYRALGESNPAFGQLVAQAPADISRWKVTELMVQTSDERVAAWSTDPRARIPLLPVLERGNLPQLSGLYISGVQQSD